MLTSEFSQSRAHIARMLLVLVAVLAVASLGISGLARNSAGAASNQKYYVSLGDSYSVGYQPTIGATSGYAGYAAKKLGMTLVNFGCGGATTTSILHTLGCPDVLRHTAGLRTYPKTTQIQAADAFLRAHRGQIGLLTVSISGNDVTSCAQSANPIPCVGAAVAGITQNVTQLVSDLRAAAGPKVPLIGLTYPDVILGSYVYPTNPGPASAQSLAQLSVVAFKSLINPALSAAYATGNGQFVDVTSASGSYVPLTNTINTKTYGTIPAAVASVCQLTWFCQKGNIHAKTSGYTLEGALIVKKYRSMIK
jgi:lysophospholipase L1-like esterase